MIKRYTPEGRCCVGMEHQVVMERDGDGDYVHFDDYQELQDDMADLQRQYDGLVAALGELYKEA